MPLLKTSDSIASRYSGPQGTLFGAVGGGTVRYITTQPSLNKSSVYAKAEHPSLKRTITMRLVLRGRSRHRRCIGVRASAWYRRDGGWIDRVDPTR